jgi:hypothetical protein
LRYKFSRIICALVLFIQILCAPAFAAENTTYKYDALGRVIESTVSSGPSNGTQTTVTYDPAGNRSNYKVAGVATQTPATLATGDASVTEGGTLSFTVTRSGNTSIAASATYASANGTAVAGSDYTAVSGTVSFAAGETSKTITVATTDDAAVESAETLTVSLSSPSANTTISTATATGTINDNDVAVSFSISGPAIAVIEGSQAVFTVTKTGATSSTFGVNFTTADGTAVVGSDYVAANGILTFAPGETSKQITINIIDDTLQEAIWPGGSEQFQVQLSGATGVATVSNASANATIIDNEASISILGPLPTATEGQPLTFLITRSGYQASVVSVSYTTSNGTAMSGTDYTARSGTLTFQAGQTSLSVTVPTIDDSAFESQESVNFALSVPTNGGYLSAGGVATGTINDNDVAPATLAIGDASVTEGGTLSFTVTRSGNTSIAASATYASANGTAVAGSDYTAVSGTVSFAAGETSKTITVATTDDAAVESAETLTVSLSSPSANTTISTATATGTINDNDVGLFFGALPNAPEGQPLTFTLTRVGAVTGSTSVNYATANGTANAGSDFTASSGTLTYAAGETSKTISITTIDDTSFEGNETFVVNLSGATGGAIIAVVQATGTINENDTMPTFDPVITGSAVEGMDINLGVTCNGAACPGTVLNYTTVDGTATSGADYIAKSGSITFGASGTGQFVTVSTLDDVLVESNNETFSVNLTWPSSGSNAGLGTGYIQENDFGANFSISDASVTEGGSLVFTVSKTGTTGSATSVTYRIANFNGSGTATTGVDYTDVSGTLNFTNSETTKTFSVPTTNDNVAEPDETLTAQLWETTGGAGISDNYGMGTIIDNDSGPSLSVSVASTGGTQNWCEGTNASFTVSRIGPATSAFSVNYATSDGTAAAGADYVAQSGTLNFLAGETTKTVSVPVIDDTATVGYEDNEAFYMNLSSPTNGVQISTGQAIGTVVDWNVCNS